MGGSGPSQPRWRGDGVGRERHPARYCARYARATKSVIDLKVDAELSDFRSGKTLRGLPQQDKSHDTVICLSFSTLSAVRSIYLAICWHSTATGPDWEIGRSSFDHFIARASNIGARPGRAPCTSWVAM